MTHPVNPSVYNQQYYQSSNYADYLERADRYKKTAYELEGLFRQISLVSKDSLIMDFGCAVGFLLEGLREQGYRNLVGVEISEWARTEALKRIPSVLPSIEHFAGSSVDLLVALDVFEHMTDREIRDVLNKTCPKAILVRIPTSTDEGKSFHLEVSRSDPTHINCKTKEQWIEFFKSFEYSNCFRLNLYTVYDTPGVTCLLIT